MAEVSEVEVAEGEYEALRAANMKRNQEIMRALGLDQSDFKLHKEHKDLCSNGKGKGKGKGTGTGNEADGNASSAPGQTRKRKSSEDEAAELSASSPATTRKSARIRGSAPELMGTENNGVGEDSARGVMSVALDELHDAAERDHLRWAGNQGKATIVGTASYKHTLHRVRTVCTR